MDTDVAVRRVIDVAMTDVDLVQINFQSYFRWMDHGFNALLRALDHPLGTVLASGYATPAVDARCRYLRPVTLDDRLTLESHVGTVGRSSFEVHHHFDLEGVPVAEGVMTHVWVTLDGAHTHSVPQWLRNAALTVGATTQREGIPTP